MGATVYLTAAQTALGEPPLMTSDQLTQGPRPESKLFFGTHSSWGFGTVVGIGCSEICHNPGRFGWTGGLGTTADQLID